MDGITEQSDYRTHHHDWVKACQIAKDNSGNDVDQSYWQHQLNTLEKLDSEFTQK